MTNYIVIYISRTEIQACLIHAVYFFEYRQHRLVDTACASASAKGQYHKFILRYAESLSCLLSCSSKKAFSYGVSHNDMLFGMFEILSGLFKAHKYLVHVRLQHFVGHPRKRILLVYVCSDTHFCRSLDNRSAYIASCAYNHIGPEAFYYFFCLGKPFDKICRSLDVFEHIASVKAAYGYEFYRVAVIWNQSFFKSLFCAHKQNFRVGLFFFNLVCNGNGRIYMSPCASACHYNFHS